jgi:large subunit ribosomal protein L27e
VFLTHGKKAHKEHKFIKPGKVVVLLAGRYAGKKAIIVKTFDEGNEKRQFGHCLVAGIERYPLEVTKTMSKKKILKRSKVKPFLKYINYTHIMPTRYVVSDIDLRTFVTPAAMKKIDTKEETKKEVKKAFEGRYLERGKNTSGVQYFFHKLRF